MVIKAQLNLAKKLRASTTKEGALLLKRSEEDVDTSVQVRKSNGVFVPRYSQPAETKSKSNVEPTKDFIDAFKKTHNIDDSGLWSVFGENYVERGAPDFKLLEKAQKHREERRRKRKGKKKAPEEEKQKKQGSSVLTTWGGEKRKTQRLTNTASFSKISIKDSDQDSAMNSDAILDHSKYKFPMNFISDSENRLKQCKSGLPFSGLIDAQIRESGRLYPMLEVMKKRPSMRAQCSNTSELSRLNSTNSHIDVEVFDDDNTFTIHLDEINRWRDKFRSVCEDMQDDLSTELAQNKLDRIEVYQSRKALGEVARLAKSRSAGRNVPKPSNLWNLAKEVRIESSQIFYRELLTFVHMKMIQEKKNQPTEEEVNLCVLIKDLLSQGQQADKELFFFCFHHFGVTCFEPCLMELFQFMRAYFSIREDRILHHIQKNGWYVSANKQKMFLDCH